MKALSIRQPWAWLIIRPDLCGDARVAAIESGQIKLIENRTWHTKHRGRFLVHASKGCTKDEYARAYRYATSLGVTGIPRLEDMQRGGIIGSVELVDSVDTSSSPWYMGEKGFLLRDPKPLPFTPYKGRLGFFDVPDELVKP